VVGKDRIEGSHLGGRVYQSTAVTPWPLIRYPIYPDRSSAEWIVKAKAGMIATVVARHDRAGAVREEIRFP